MHSMPMPSMPMPSMPMHSMLMHASLFLNWKFYDFSSFSWLFVNIWMNSIQASAWLAKNKPLSNDQRASSMITLLPVLAKLASPKRASSSSNKFRIWAQAATEWLLNSRTITSLSVKKTLVLILEPRRRLAFIQNSKRMKIQENV